MSADKYNIAFRARALLATVFTVPQYAQNADDMHLLFLRPLANEDTAATHAMATLTANGDALSCGDLGLEVARDSLHGWTPLALVVRQRSTTLRQRVPGVNGQQPKTTRSSSLRMPPLTDT